MKKTITTKTTSVILAFTILISSCASTTLIQSNPSGAKLYLDGEKAGKTPYSYTDTKIVFSPTTVRLEKEGYETFNTTFTRDEEAHVGAIIGGFLVGVPFLWSLKYKPSHSYELSPVIENNQSTISTTKKQYKKTKADRLREIKQLLDDKIITQGEFDNEKKKILEE